MPEDLKLLSYEQVIEKEDERLKERRRKLFDEAAAEQLEETKFGIAMSGGGIRSATINMGFLKTLNKFDILKKADYISTVSGGGYTGAYVQAILKKEKDFKSLFDRKHIDYMRMRGEYLMPGTNWGKKWNTLLLTVGYLVSLVMSWISPIIIISLFAIAYLFFSELNLGIDSAHELLFNWQWIYGAAIIVGGVFIFHFFANISLNYNLGISKKFNQVETALAGIGLIWLLAYTVTSIGNIRVVDYQVALWHIAILGAIVFLLGFFTNPNSVSFHRFYRHQLAEAFLHFSAEYRNVRLQDLIDSESTNPKDYLAPYPLINTCLNLQALDGSDEKFKGAKASDYFLLSPLYCGSKLSKYIPTNSYTDYYNMTLPAATTISAAAVNPGMGMYSNKMLSILMTVFNARLGYWVSNPLKKNRTRIVWWPFYFFYELFSLTGTNNRKLNISDGGHIENLGIYELLRRKCRLILAVDGGADPKFTFVDLENLTIRARNELGLDINFRPDQIPEEVIRPRPSHGYSKKRFAIADINQLWEEILIKDSKGKVIKFPKKDRKGNIIRNKNGQETQIELEVLINYNSLKKDLDRLDKYDKEKLKRVLDSLKLAENIREVIHTLDLKKHEEVKKILNSLQINKDIQRVFNSTMDLLNAIKTKIKDKIPPSEQEFVFKQLIATIEDKVRHNLKIGTLVYIKSSVTAPSGKPHFENRNSLDYGTYKYKVYHPSFPHEPTSDQFFDPIQWESYYKLGQFIGADVLDDQDMKTFSKQEMEGIDIEHLIEYFDNNIPLFMPEGLEAEEKESEEVTARGGINLDTIIQEKANDIESGEVESPESEPMVKAGPPRDIPPRDTVETTAEETLDPELADMEQKAQDETLVVGEEVKYKM